jgi:hypothetical protein
MKVSIDVDCTPEEARRFMGLPDLTPVHAAYIDKMQKAVSEGLTPDRIAEMMAGWNPMGDAGMKMWTDMMGKMSGKP